MRRMRSRRTSFSVLVLAGIAGFALFWASCKPQSAMDASIEVPGGVSTARMKRHFYDNRKTYQEIADLAREEREGVNVGPGVPADGHIPEERRKDYLDLLGKLGADGPLMVRPGGRGPDGLEVLICLQSADGSAAVIAKGVQFSPDREPGPLVDDLDEARKQSPGGPDGWKRAYVKLEAGWYLFYHWQ